MQSSANAHRQPRSTRPAHSRARSSSDPFIDPIYQPPNLSYTTALPRHPPAPPPKQPKKPTRAHNDPRMLENAVREAVTIRDIDPAPRTRVNRSQTGVTQVPIPRHAQPTTRRSYSQDSANVTQTATAVEKARKAGKPSKKGSSHADVIDRLDFTGNGPMFHHDGPFDACAPSRNRHKLKAPMLAWTSGKCEGPISDTHPEADWHPAAVDNMRVGNRAPLYTEMGDNPPKNPKEVDLIAKAWGIHEPEPYEEFFGGGGHSTGDISAASSVRGGYENHAQGGRNRGRDGRELRELNIQEGRPPPTRKHLSRNMPPPQPINLPGAGRTSSSDAGPPSLPSPGLASSPGAPKRSKSLMQKIRKMRDAPNVPVDTQSDEDISPPSSVENYASSGYPSPTDGGRQGRSAHRHQNSFFGRFGRNTSVGAGQVSPTDSGSRYVYVEKSLTSNKALPPRPAGTPASPLNSEKDGYFDGPSSPGGTGGIGRKTSLLKKVKGAVRGAGNK